MILTPTFEFKGIVLPVLDKHDRFYIFVKNECGHKVLLNLVTYDINKFVYINKNFSQLIQCGMFKPNLQLKIFYMGQELFDFSTTDIDKNVLYAFSDYIINGCVDTERIDFYVSTSDGCRIFSTSKKPQKLYIKAVDKDTNEIIHEDVFISNESYVFKPKSQSYEVIILNSDGEKIYQQDI